MPRARAEILWFVVFPIMQKRSPSASGSASLAGSKGVFSWRLGGFARELFSLFPTATTHLRRATAWHATRRPPKDIFRLPSSRRRKDSPYQHSYYYLPKSPCEFVFIRGCLSLVPTPLRCDRCGYFFFWNSPRVVCACPNGRISLIFS